MSAAVEAGKIDRFGISNASLTDVQEVGSVADERLASRLEYVQNEFNLLATTDAEALIPWCAAHGLRYTAFSPLAGGLLTGKYRFDSEPPPNSRLAHAAEIYKGHLNAKSFAAIERLRQSAEARQQTMAEAALHFVLDSPGVDGLIIAPRTIEQFAGLGFAS
jgi:aryl-alcohol dehydrogenase-like predicted oxidoreductase